ncbi:hypothetical protein [Nocardia niwae]|uniref:hypothetical protein n=1 Tax=Nocardia niwae TaxID=626084 RepID=UPI0033C59BBB
MALSAVPKRLITTRPTATAVSRRGGPLSDPPFPRVWTRKTPDPQTEIAAGKKSTMIAVLMRWLSSLDPSSYVGVDKYGLSLVETHLGSGSGGARIEVGGGNHSAEDTTPTGVPAHAARVSVLPDFAVVTVSDLQEMGGGRLTRTELEHVRAAIKRSTITESLCDVVFAVTETRRHELTDAVRAFPDASAYAGCLGVQPLASVPPERIASLLTEIETATGLALVRLRCGDEARLCVDDRATGRLFQLDATFEAWLSGYSAAPGPTVDWIGSAISDLTRDELVNSGPRDYVLSDTLLLPATRWAAFWTAPRSRTWHTDTGRP